MSDKYKIFDNDAAYFMTMTVVGWIDLFTQKAYKYIIVDSLKYCKEKKGLQIFGWCLMPSHLHLICRVSEGYILTDIIRDFKKFTSKEIVKRIIDGPDSRQEWMLPLLRQYCNHLKREQTYKVWQDGNHAEIINSNKFFEQKLNYIHQNPVVEGWVQEAHEYLYSSARNYADLPSVLEVIVDA